MMSPRVRRLDDVRDEAAGWCQGRGSWMTSGVRQLDDVIVGQGSWMTSPRVRRLADVITGEVTG